MNAGGGRGAFEGWLRAYWSGQPVRGGTLATPVLLVLSWLFRGVVALRNAAFNQGVLRTSAPPIPVLSVGNLVVGGTGKTPVTRWVLNEIEAQGGTPAVVSRGYGEDEVSLHRMWNPHIPVWIAPRRMDGVRRAAQAGAEVAVVDDGFQHRWLGRQVDLVLLAAEDPFPGPCLPRGPYREPARAIRRAHGVLVTARGGAQRQAAVERARAVTEAFGVSAAVVTLSASGWRWIDGGAAPPPPLDGVQAVTSIARPEGFIALMAQEGIPATSVLLRAYPDHHPFAARDLEGWKIPLRDGVRSAGGGLPLVMTEKDAVKLLPLLEGHAQAVDARVLELKVEPEPDAEVLLRTWVSALLSLRRKELL
jgi:tetraacyldisaccharide 4'-kinase